MHNVFGIENNQLTSQVSEKGETGCEELFEIKSSTRSFLLKFYRLFYVR